DVTSSARTYILSLHDALPILVAREHPFRLEEVGTRLRLPGERLADGGFRACHGGLVLGRVDPQQDLPALDDIALLHVQLDDAPHDVRLHVHRAVRADPAAARDHRGQVPTGHGLDAGLDGPARPL